MLLGKQLAAYLATGAVFFIIDLAWLTIMNPRFYKPQLSMFMADKVNLLPAVLFYLLFPVGLLVLAVIPAVEKDSSVKAVLWGSLLGLVAYSTYDLTNLASFKNWPASVTVVDIAWGTVLSAVTAGASFFIVRFIH